MSWRSTDENSACCAGVSFAQLAAIARLPSSSMSRNPRTLVVTFAARSCSAFEPAAGFCFSRVAIVSFASFTIFVPAPAAAGATGLPAVATVVPVVA